MKGHGYKASVTVFLSMIMFLLIGVVMSLVEVSKIHNMKVYRRVAAEGAIDSVFAEYHIGLREEYGLFGLDGSYKAGEFSVNNVLERFTYYGGAADESNVKSMQLMTDNQGVGFLDQVLYYMKETTGLNFLEDTLGLTQEWESIDIETGTKGEEGLSDLVDMKDVVTEGFENPLSSLLDLDMNGILNLVVANKEMLSDNVVDINSLPSQRQLETGFGTSTTLDSSATTKKLALIEYALNMLDNASNRLSAHDGQNGSQIEVDTGQIISSNILEYQLEYLLGGDKSDKENLKEVVHKLLLIRTPINYACLRTDSVKKAEVQVLATAIVLATGAVGTESIIAESLLWAWSYGESIVDVKSLLSGYSLSLTKSSSQWQLDLSSLLNLGSANLSTDKEQEGMNYKEYLRILLYLQSLEILTGRAMDIVELTLKSASGGESFRLDQCISRLELQIQAEVGMAYSYSFPIIFAYR